MTPKTIELKQAPVVLVELQEGAKEAHLDIRTGRICWSTLIEATKGGRTWHYLSSDYIGAKAVGILSDLTEEQFAECVDKYENSNPSRYVNYTYKKPNGGMQVSRVTFPWRNKSSDSFYSLLESEKVYMENPYARPSYHDADRNYWMLEDKWQEAQSRTIDPTRTVVLLRKED